MARGRAAFDELQRLIRRVEGLGDPEFAQGLTGALAGDELRLIDRSLATSIDCYGKPMPMRVDDGAAPLVGLRGTFTATWDANGAQVSSSKWFAGVHNAGATIKAKNGPYLKFRLPSGRFAAKAEVTLPKRQFAPTNTYGLGPIWGPALQRVARDYVRRRVEAG